MTERHFLVPAAFCGIVLGMAPSACAPPPHAPPGTLQMASIDRFVEREMAITHVPGAAIGIYRRGRILLAKGYGLANVELDVPVKPQTVFESGSVGKQFVSAAIMMLVEQGRVSLDDSITKYFPEAPASWKPIEIKNLLSHTSGLSEYETPERTGLGDPFYLRLDFTEDELARKIEAMPIENPPGAKWNYRNTNYVLLGILIHRVTGKFYGDYLAERIFKPLGMTSTRVISDADIVPNRSGGYEWENGKLRNEEWVSPTFNSTADGALYFNVLDLAKWDAALYGTQLLKRSSLDRIWTVYTLNDGKPNPAGYGFAWRIHERRGHLVVEHSGAWEGFACNITRYPNDGLTVVVLTNMDSDHSRPDYMAPVIAGLIDPALQPEKLAEIRDDQPQLAASLRSVLNTRHAPSSVWPGGVLTLVARMPSADNGSLTFSQYRLTKGTHSMLVTYALDARGKVDTLYFEPDKEYRTDDLYGG